MFLDLLSAFLQKFLEVVLPVLATALAGLAVAWIAKIVNDTKSRLSSDAEWVINQAVDAAIMAAEQMHLVDAVIDKKDYALTAATNWLESKGIKVDLNILDTLIEAAVMNNFNIYRAKALRAIPSGPSGPE